MTLLEKLKELNATTGKGMTKKKEHLEFCQVWSERELFFRALKDIEARLERRCACISPNSEDVKMLDIVRVALEAPHED